MYPSLSSLVGRSLCGLSVCADVNVDPSMTARRSESFIVLSGQLEPAAEQGKPFVHCEWTVVDAKGRK